MKSPRASLLILARVLLSFVLVLAMGAGSAGRASCAMHGMGSAGAQGATGAAAGTLEHVVAHHHQQGAPHDEHPNGCCCGGDCSGVAQMARVPEAVTVRVAVIIAQPVSVFEPHNARMELAEPDRLLPFANGPPVVASV